MRESRRLFCLMAALGLPLALGGCTGETELARSDAAVASCTANGSAVDLSTNVNNCGTCGNVCASGKVCAAGSCVNATSPCSAGYADCDGDTSNGCEVDVSSDSVNCGACGNICATGQVCSQGQCVNASINCPVGFADCNAISADGCEVNTLTDQSNCGSCSTSCPSGSSCANGQCQGNGGQVVCAGALVDPRTDVLNCGGCGKACPTIAHAADACVDGVCVTQCSQGYGDCDGTLANGCEADLQSNSGNCGFCARVCGSDSTCTQGACLPKSTPCSAGFDDCDANPTTGCETNLATDANNCGACGNKCSLPNATPACTANACTIAACNAGYADCDGDPANGCEVSINTSAHCGVCTLSCNFPNASSTCSNGACTLVTCNAGWGNCDGNSANGCEADLSTSNSNCGACGLVCDNGRTCKQGTCTQTTPVCVGNYADCDGLAANGCEMDIGLSVDNCGACGNKCSLPNATPACSNRACTISICNSGFGNCDNNATNGCEVNLSTDPNNCGSCNRICGANQQCTAGQCT
jgi:hypothetical protein